MGTERREQCIRALAAIRRQARRLGHVCDASEAESARTYAAAQLNAVRAQLVETDPDIDIFFPPLPADASLPLIGMIAGQLADFVAPDHEGDEEPTPRVSVQIGDGVTLSPPSLEQVGEVIRRAVSGAVSGLTTVAHKAGQTATKAAEHIGWIDTDKFSDEELDAEVTAAEARIDELADKEDQMTSGEAAELRDVTRRFSRLKHAQVKREVARQVARARAAAAPKPPDDCDGIGDGDPPTSKGPES